VDEEASRVAFGARRLKRRPLLRGAAAFGAGVASVGLLGCRPRQQRSPDGAKTGGSASGSATPKRGGSLAIGANFRLGFDPHVQITTNVTQFGMFYSKLVRNNPKTYALEPDLAAKWEVPSQTELVFTLAPNIKWQDKPPVNGRLLKVDDIIYSYNRIRTDDPRFLNKSYLSGIDRMEAVDDHTLRLTLKQPDVTQLGSLAVPTLAVLAPEVVEKADKFSTAEDVVGTGPFILRKSEESVGSSLVRNPNYFKPGLPYLDSIEIRAFQDSQSEWSAFLGGRLDHRYVPGQDAQKFQDEQSSRYTLDWFGDQIYFITQAMTPKKPWSDPRVTRAMRLLIDHGEFKSAWATSWFGRSRFSGFFAAATADEWDLSEDEYNKFLEWKPAKDDANKEALALLAAAGFTKDTPLKFTLDGTSSQAYQAACVQLTQAQFKKGSQGVVDPTIKLSAIKEWDALRSSSNFEYLVGGHSGGGVDPDLYFNGTYKTGGGRNYGKFSDPTLDQMIAKQRTIFDGQERKKAVREIILYMVDHCPYGSLVAGYVLNATVPKVRGFAAEGTSITWGDHYETVSIAT
jgi:peptide/nickel transport system substrate-binding protein